MLPPLYLQNYIAPAMCAQTEWMNERILMVAHKEHKKNLGKKEIWKSIILPIMIWTLLVKTEVWSMFFRTDLAWSWGSSTDSKSHNGHRCYPLPWWPITLLSFCNPVVCFSPRLWQASQGLLHPTSQCHFNNQGNLTPSQQATIAFLIYTLLHCSRSNHLAQNAVCLPDPQGFLQLLTPVGLGELC